MKWIFRKVELLYKKFRLRKLIPEYDYSNAEFKLIAALIRNQNAICVDAGASYGVYSYFLSRHSEKVYAFEPVSLSYELLKYQMKINHADNVDMIEMALSDKPGRC